MQFDRLPADRQPATDADLHRHVSPTCLGRQLLSPLTDPFWCLEVSPPWCRYFIAADVVLVVQYIYFGALQRQQARLKALRSPQRPRHHPHRHNQVFIRE